MEAVGRFDLGGLVLHFGPNDHQGMDTVYLTRIYPVVQELTPTDGLNGIILQSTEEESFRAETVNAIV